jgi:type VI secretion system secreted protein VgrG
MADVLQVRIESPALSPDAVKLFELGGREAISQLFGFEVHLVTTDPAGLDEEAVLASPAVLVFERGGNEVRRVGGMIASVQDRLESETVHAAYTLSFVPRAYRLTLVTTSEIFMDLSVPDIVKKKLERAGLVSGDDFELRLGSYPSREFVVQYQETDLAFVSRLAEHLGIYFFFEQSDDKDVIVFADKNSGSKPIAGDAHVAFRSRGERTGVHALSSLTKTVPSRYVVKDYNYRTPGVALLAQASQTDGGGYIVEYGAHFKTPDEGAKIAQVRAEELRASRKVFTGTSDAQALAAGATFKLEGHARGDVELLLTEVTHRAVQGALGMGGAGEHKYENEFQAIPYETQYRPPRITPKPRVPGVITGTIDAAAKGPYAELDGDGRYRVRFMFDTGDAGDGKASRLVRMAQPHSGGGYGMHFPLRSGVEVILAFVEGDPDRPIIAGTVPNPASPGPVGSKNAARNIIRTGGNNEINMDDTGGSERIKFSSPFGDTVIQLGAPNEPEEGVAITTKKQYSAVVDAGTNVLTTTSTAITDMISAFATNDIIQSAGKPSLKSVLQALPKIASDVAAAIQSVADLPSKWYEQKAKVAKSVATETATAVKAATVTKTTTAAVLKYADDQLAQAQKGGDKDAIAAATSAQKTAKAMDDQAQSNLTSTTAAGDAAAEASTAADAEEQDAANGTGAEVSAVMGEIKSTADAVAAIAGDKALISTLATAWEKVWKKVTVIDANATVALANTMLSVGPISGTVIPLATPVFVGDGLAGAALTSEATTFVAGKLVATLFSPKTAIVAGGAAVVVKSELDTGICGLKKVEIISPLDVMIEGGMKIDITSKGTMTENVTGKQTIMVGDYLFSTDTDVAATVKRNMIAETQDGFVKLTSKGAVTIISQEPAIKLDASPVTLELDKDKGRLGHGDWVFIANAEGVKIGNGSSGAMAKDGEVRLMTDGGDLKLDGDLTLKVSSVKFDVDGQVKIDGSKICFG